MKGFGGALLAAGLMMATPAFAAPVVEAPAGTVEGKSVGKMRVFRGIPYAQPPVGPLRWKPPVALPAWPGVRKAQSFGAACIQPRSSAVGIYTNPPAKLSEDCLTLNIWAPEAAKDAPVILWIHGGSLVSAPPWIHTITGAFLTASGAQMLSVRQFSDILGGGLA